MKKEKMVRFARECHTRDSLRIHTRVSLRSFTQTTQAAVDFALPSHQGTCRILKFGGFKGDLFIFEL